VAEVGPGPLPDTIRRLEPAYLVLCPVGPLPSAASVPSGSVRTRLVAHVGGAPESVRPWVGLAGAALAGIEVGPGPERFDSSAARSAREAGVALAIAMGLDEAEDGPTRDVAIGFARRAGARKEDVANAGDPAAPRLVSKRTRR